MEHPVRAGSLGVNSDLDSIFTPDIMVASQFFDGMRKSAREPEQRLMLAVLVDAIRAFQRGAAAKPGTKGAAARHEAAAWLWGDSDVAFSFNGVCEALGIEPSYLRRGLIGWDGDLGRRSVTTRGNQIGLTRYRGRR